MCFLLFLTGIYGVLTRRNLIKVVISLTIMEFSLFLMLAMTGYISGGEAPIVSGFTVRNLTGSGSPAAGNGADGNSHCAGNKCNAADNRDKALQEIRHIRYKRDQ
jgi:hypothetical protein